MFNIKKLFTIGVLTTALLFVTACGEKKEEVKIEVKSENNILKVVAAYGGKEQIFNKFTETTGIKVEFIDMSSGEVLSRMEAENGRPTADVWFGGGLDSFIAAKDKGLLEKYISPETEFIDKQYMDKEGYWTGISLVMVGMMVNNDLLKEKKLPAPSSWEDLANPIYKDEVMIADPTISGTNYAMVYGLITAMGEEKAWSYLVKLNRNVPFLAKRGGEPPKKVSLGEFAVGVIPMSGEMFAYEKKYPVTAIYPTDMIPYVPAGMSIFKNTPNLENAKKFIDWVLSKEGQEYIRDQDPRVMVRKGVETPESLRTVPTEKFIKIDFEKLGKDRNRVLKIWNEKFGKKAE